MPAESYPIRYRIRPAHPEAHLFEIELSVERPDPDGQRLSLPAWIPGSYMIREFARHVVRIAARCGRRPVNVTISPSFFSTTLARSPSRLGPPPTQVKWTSLRPESLTC